MTQSSPGLSAAAGNPRKFLAAFDSEGGGFMEAVVIKRRAESSNIEAHENMTRAEAAKYLRVSSAHVSNLAHGKVPGMPSLRFSPLGRRLIFRRIWLDEFVEAAANQSGWPR